VEAHSPASAKHTFSQQQQNQQQQQQQQHDQSMMDGCWKGPCAAGGRQGLQDELSAGQLSTQRLQHYSSFVRFMGLQHNWRARALAAHTTR
jgi:hypothetical protein